MNPTDETMREANSGAASRWPTRRSLTGRVLAHLALAAVFISACAHNPASAPVWLSRFHHDHPLAGRVWNVRTRTFVEPRDVGAAAARARYVLLGEKHDNPDHHRLQAEVLAAMVNAGRHPAVAFEMLEAPQQEVVDRYRGDPAHDAAGLGPAVRWADTTWPP